MADHIGLVFSGCNKGFHIICENNVGNFNESVVHKVIIDIRKDIVVQKSYIDYYSVEFVLNYSIFTGYRSSRDLGRDGYIAVSVFVDSSYCIVHFRNLLKELLDCYFKNYMNPLTWEPVANKIVDIKLFQTIVDKYEVVSLAPATHIIPGDPKYIVYDSDEKLDSYLEGAFRCDFTHWQKVYYLSKNVTDDRDMLELHIQSVSDKVKLRPQVDEKEKSEGKIEITSDKHDENDVMPPIFDIDTTDSKDQEELRENKYSKKILALAATLISVILFGTAYYFYSDATDSSGYSIESLVSQQNIEQQDMDAQEEVLPVDTVAEEFIEQDSVIPDAASENLVRKTPKDSEVKEIKILNIKLDRLDITKRDVERILERAKELGDSKLIQRANAYLWFFNATSLDDVHKAVTYFSSEQRRTCVVTYLKDSKTFEICKRRFGMDFRKAKDYIKSDFNER